jgi:hypothetical protein
MTTTHPGARDGDLLPKIHTKVSMILALVDPLSALDPLRQFAVQWIFQVRPELAGCVIVIWFVVVFEI